MAKRIEFNIEARNKLKKGVDILTSAVSCTLGPKGRNVIIDRSPGPPHITKDGVTVAKSIELSDPIENMGAQLVKEVASKTNELAGDGTTTATVLTQAIFNDGLKYVTAGANPMDLKRGIDIAVSEITKVLSSVSKPVSTSKEIEQIATISANNDATIGKMMATAMDKVGKDGIITVEESRGTENEVKTVEGMQFDKGTLSPYFITDQEKMNTVFKNPYVLLYDSRISAIKDILPILEEVAASDRPLLIVAEDVDGEALSALVVNKLRGTLQVAAVKAPAFGDRRDEILEDTAVLTGAKVFSSETSAKLDTITLDDLGSAEKIIIDKTTTTFVNGGGELEKIKARIEKIKGQIDNVDSEYDKEKLQERLAKISGGVAIIYIGAATETELKEKKDRVDDALHATRAAVQEGIIIGGGIAFIKALDSITDLVGENPDQNLGIQIIKSAIQAPFRIIIQNGGGSPDVIINEIKKVGGNYGYDARTETYTDMFKAGIVDPTKVTRLALEHAASVGGLLLTTEAVIAKKPISDQSRTYQN